MAKSPSEKFAVIGAGQMGNGIAHVCATSGFAVVLIDVSAEALAKGKATIELTNNIPSLDYPDAVIGNNDQGFPPGTNEVWLNFYTPLRYVSSTVNGERTPLGTEREFNMWVYNQFFQIGPGETLTVEIELAGNLGPMDEYRLNVGHQPLEPVAAGDLLGGAGLVFVDEHDLILPPAHLEQSAPEGALVDGALTVLQDLLGCRLPQVDDRLALPVCRQDLVRAVHFRRPPSGP